MRTPMGGGAPPLMWPRTTRTPQKAPRTAFKTSMETGTPTLSALQAALQAAELMVKKSVWKEGRVVTTGRGLLLHSPHSGQSSPWSSTRPQSTGQGRGADIPSRTLPVAQLYLGRVGSPRPTVSVRMLWRGPWQESRGFRPEVPLEARLVVAPMQEGGSRGPTSPTTHHHPMQGRRRTDNTVFSFHLPVLGQTLKYSLHWVLRPDPVTVIGVAKPKSGR